MDIQLLIYLILGLALLVFGGSLLVRGASQLARVVGMSPIVIGLTVVAFGTSAPELATSVAATLRGQSDIAFGNVVGSNIFNILLILGASALIGPLVVAQKLVRIDVPIMIGLTIVLLVLAWNGVIGRGEGALLLLALALYIAFTVRLSRNESSAIRAEYAQEYGTRRQRFASLGSSLIFVAIGLVLLVLGSRWLVDGAVGVARTFGVSELIIGLTIVAAGTSLPEVATSLLAAWKGERDIAVGNVIGSNIFNILGVLSSAAVLAPDGVAVATSALRFDLPVMIAASLACLPIFATGHRVDRWEGIVLLLYYVAYVAYLVLDATGHDHLSAFSWIMLAFVIPLTLLTFVIVLVRELRGRRHGAAAGGSL